MTNDVWDEITCSFPSVNDCAVDVCNYVSMMGFMLNHIIGRGTCYRFIVRI